MIWSKYYAEDRKVPGIVGTALVLIVASLYMQSKLVLFLAVFFLAIIFMNHVYLKKAGTNLYFHNPPSINRFFINEKGKWLLHFSNKGLPILKGELMVVFDHCVSPDDPQVDSSLEMYEMTFVFSISSHSTQQVMIPFTAGKRGVARIRKLQLKIPSLLGFGEVVLENKFLIKQEAIVYPNPIPVIGLQERFSLLQGETPVQYSVFEDRLGPLGTRNYVSSDSFNRIHWKASVRKQTLQTKVYELISEKGWNVSINVSDGHAITAELEPLLSSVTKFAYFAYSQNIPFSLCVNIRTAGSKPFYYVATGTGKDHLQKVLETLACINSMSSTFPYEKMLMFYYRHLAVQPYFIHGGIKTAAADKVFEQMKRSGRGMLRFLIMENHAVLTHLTDSERGVRQ
nr:DUF58 domain-containing protein [Neobacillus sp. Marseille-Q6967]